MTTTRIPAQTPTKAGNGKAMRRVSELSDDEKKVVRKQVVKSPPTPSRGRKPLVQRQTRCAVCTLPNGECEGHSPPSTPSPKNRVKESPHKATTVKKATPVHSTAASPVTSATYKDLSRSVGHTIRCYVTSEYVLKLVRKQEHRSNALLSDAESLNLKCSGIGEEFVRIENLGGLRNLKTLVATNHAFSKIEGLQPLQNLTVLDLSHNRLQRVENISHLIRLKDLNLSGNFIEHIPPPNTFPPTLEALCMSHNRLASLDDLHHLRGLVNLIYLDLRENPMCAHSHYRSIGAYAGLSIKYLDTVEVTEVERSAALYHWDRKGLKPLESELRETKKLLESTRKELESTKQSSAQKDGQLDAVTQLLQLTSNSSETLRKDKIRTEEELKQNQTSLASMQSNLLRTKSDLEFLKIEMETLYPEASQEIISQCMNTLGGPIEDVVSPVRPPPPKPVELPTVLSVPSPPVQKPQVVSSVTRQIDLGSVTPARTPVPKTPELLQAVDDSRGFTFKHVQEQARKAVVTLPDEKGDFSTPPHYDPDARSPSKPTSEDFNSISPTPEDPIIQKEMKSIKKPALPAGITRALEEKAAKQKAERQQAQHGHVARQQKEEVIVTAVATPNYDSQFRKLIKKALYCEKCAEAYVAKARAELAKCSSEHVLAKLEALYPDFTVTLTEQDIMEYAEGQLKYHQERSAWCEKKRQECFTSGEKYLKRAMELVPHLN